MKRLLVLLVALAMAISACGGSDGEASDDDAGDASAATTLAPGDPANGQELYAGTCMVCHGQAGEGVEGLGKPWVGSDFINSRTDAEMLAFLIEGRPSDHPDNTTGVAMMPRGGNPNLTDADLLDLIAYMRTLNPGVGS
jgi:mono/diheme cytochrome c family protein